MGNLCVSPSSTSLSTERKSSYLASNPSHQRGGSTASDHNTVDHGYAKVTNRCMNPKGVSESMVHFYEVINQENCDSKGCVRAGCLLRWMDICACLSAEKHGMLSSVTLSMDDLSFEEPAYLGDVLEISARVNNAFNTSMEVGVLVESMGGKPGGKSTSIVHCKAFFTFVSLDHRGVKCKVPKVIPETEAERDNYSMAKERRLMRFRKKEMIREILDGDSNDDDRRGSEMSVMSGSTTPTPWNGKKKRLSVMLRDSIMSPAESSVRMMHDSSLSMTKVVLPSDANHMGNTFGGNIMSWMDDAAVVCATKHCHYGPLIGSGLSVITIAVDAFSFLGPSKCGDRITLLAQINRAFGTTMEVGVRVEAQSLGGQSRHINTGYLTVIAKDKNGKPTTIPKIKPGNEAEKLQHKQALARRKLRMERKKLAGSGGDKHGIAWTWSSEMSKEISIANVFGLLKVNNSFDLEWKDVTLGLDPNPFQIRMEMNTDTWGLGLTTIRISGVVTCPLESMFKAVVDVGMRKKWDLAVAEYDTMEVIDDNNAIIRASFKSFGPTSGKDKDFCLLRTWSHDAHRYIVASRSIVHPSLPPRDTHQRGSVNPSGFILTPWVMDDGLGRGEEIVQTSFDYVVQLDEVGQKLVGASKGGESPFVKLIVGSLTRLGGILMEEGRKKEKAGEGEEGEQEEGRV